MRRTSKRAWTWVGGALAALVVAVALANRTARIIWALLAKGGIYRAPIAAA